MRSGIIRRIDDLGRIVVPKEIRRLLHVKENDPLEISVCGKSIMLEKYEPPETLGMIATPPLKVLTREYDAKIAVCSESKVLQCFGFPMLADGTLFDSVQYHIDSGIEYIAKDTEKGVCLYEDNESYRVRAIIPLKYGSDQKGGLVLLGEKGDEVSSEMLAQMRFTARLLEDQAKDWL